MPAWLRNGGFGLSHTLSSVNTRVLERYNGVKVSYRRIAGSGTDAIMKSKPPDLVAIPETHANKYSSYREALGHIRRAVAYGYHLEAVTLEESIIAARLISFLVCVGAIEADTRVKKYGFGQLVQRWLEIVPEPIETKYFPDLQTAVDAWWKRRNNIVHGMLQSVPGTHHEDPLNFLKEAQSVAFEGAALAAAISDWGRKVRKQLSKGSRH